MRRPQLARRDLVDLGVIGTTHGLSDGYSGMLKPVLALIVADLSLSTFQAGALLSFFSLGTFLFLYPLSLVADYGSRKKELLIGGLALSTLAFFSMPWATTFGLLTLLAFLAGAGNATFHPCGSALTAERFADKRAFAVSTFSMMGNAGASLMPVVQAAIAVVYGWRMAILLCATPALALLPLVAFRFQNLPRPDSRPLREAGGTMLALTRQVLSNRAVVLLALIYALTGMGTGIVAGFLALLAEARFALGANAVGVALALYFLAGVLTKPVMGYLYDRLGARTALITPLVVAGLATLAIALTPYPATFIPLIILLGLASPISPIILTAAADRSDPKVLASSVGLIYTCYGLGFISPLIGGWLAELYSLTVSYVYGAGLFWIGALLATRLKEK